MDMFEIFLSIVGLVAPRWADRRRVRVTTHRAWFLDGTGQAVGEEHLFVTITNLSRSRELTVTHVWFVTDPEAHIVDNALPRRLRPDDSWETAIGLSQLPEGVREDAFNLARARLSTGAVVSSTRNENVPAFGRVPRGGQHA